MSADKVDLDAIKMQIEVSRKHLDDRREAAKVLAVKAKRLQAGRVADSLERVLTALDDAVGETK